MALYLLTLRALKFWANGVRRGRSRRISPDFSSSLRLLQMCFNSIFFNSGHFLIKPQPLNFRDLFYTNLDDLPGTANKFGLMYS
jgi:hypothetical protein